MLDSRLIGNTEMSQFQSDSVLGLVPVIERRMSDVRVPYKLNGALIDDRSQLTCLIWSESADLPYMVGVS